MKMEEASVSEDPRKVSEMFEDALKLFHSIEKSNEPSNSTELYVQIKKAIKLFEEITRAVSVLGMFSSNESVEEIASEDLKFLLLPVYLGSLSLRLDQKDRLRLLDVADIYFKDFLQRCKDYGLTDVSIPGRDLEEEDSDSMITGPSGIPPNLLSMVKSRNEKIQRFKEQKEYEAHLDQLTKSTNGDWSANEEQRRDYLLTLIRYWINKTVEELLSIEMERPILKHMEEMKLKGKKLNDDDSKLKIKKTPLQTVIITKDKIQKAVYGAGYPSLPTYTVDEFYEQRMKSGEFPDPCCRPSNSLQDHSLQKAQAEGGSDDEDNPKTEKEEAKELKEAREFDDYKDFHHRGWGNRMNRS